MAICEYCGAEVQSLDVVAHVENSVTHYFCSAADRQHFLEHGPQVPLSEAPPEEPEMSPVAEDEDEAPLDPPAAKVDKRSKAYKESHKA